MESLPLRSGIHPVVRQHIQGHLCPYVSRICPCAKRSIERFMEMSQQSSGTKESAKCPLFLNLCALSLSCGQCFAT